MARIILWSLICISINIANSSIGDSGIGIGSWFELMQNEARAKEEFARYQLDTMKNMASVSEEFDVKRYDLEFEIFPENEEIRGRVDVTAVVLSPSDALLLNMDSEYLCVDSISGDADAWIHENKLLTLLLNDEFQSGDRIRTSIFYHGSPRISGAVANNGSIFGECDGVPVICTYSCPFGARDWWPCKDQNDDKADTVTISVIVPSLLKVVSNGSLISIESVDEQRTRYEWIETHPIATFLVSIAISDYAIHEEWYISGEGDSLLNQLYLIPEQAADAAEIFSYLLPSLQAFESYFGPYPFADEKYTQATGWGGGGWEHQTCTTMPYHYVSEHLVDHELAHQWWGDMITCDTFHHVWLNEGFASYSQALAAEAQEGMDSYYDWVNRFRILARMPGTVYVEDPETEPIFDLAMSYWKPAYVLHMLRHVLGDDNFFTALRHYRDCFEYSTTTTEDFQNAVEEVWGSDLSWFIEQWIYWELYPQYEYEWECRPGQSPIWLTSIVIRQIQTDTELFKMPVDVRLTFEDGSEETNVAWVDHSFENIFTIGTNQRVTDIELDPDDWVLCDIREAGSGVDESLPIFENLFCEEPCPNPSMDFTTFEMRLPSDGILRLYSIDGRLRDQQFFNAGLHSVRIPLDDVSLPPGAYILRISTSDHITDRKIVFLR